MKHPHPQTFTHGKSTGDAQPFACIDLDPAEFKTWAVIFGGKVRALYTGDPNTMDRVAPGCWAACDHADGLNMLIPPDKPRAIVASVRWRKEAIE